MLFRCYFSVIVVVCLYVCLSVVVSSVELNLSDSLGKSLHLMRPSPEEDGIGLGLTLTKRVLRLHRFKGFSTENIFRKSPTPVTICFVWDGGRG